MFLRCWLHYYTKCNVIIYLFIYTFIILINPVNAELNTICHLLALLGARHIFHVSELRVKDAISNTDIERIRMT